jgi:hypothetical protein
MARDYKHTHPRSSGSLSASGGFVIGLLIGLTIAMAIYMYDHRPGAQVSSTTPPLTSEQPSNTKDTPAPESAQAETNYDFYEYLPQAEVEVTNDKNKSGSTNSTAGMIDAPGSYILQVGSYRNFADADRVRARIALQGIESNIQKVTIDNEPWHRVRIGPMNNLNRLEETRRKLREAQIDALVVKLEDSK